MKSNKSGRHLLDQCRERVAQLETCFQITSLLNRELELDSLLRTIIRSAKNVMKADIASLALIDEERGDLVFQIAMGKGRDHIGVLGDKRRMNLGDGINGKVAQTGTPILIQDVHEDPTFDTQYEALTGMQFGAMVCAPIKVKNRILGSCSVIHDAALGKTVRETDLALFQLFCDSAALAIQNTQAHQTQLKNQRLEQDISFSRGVQEGFLPEAPPRIPKFDFDAQTLPAQVVGGDYYDFIPMGENEVAMFLGDVSGKGFAAALHMARLMSDFRYVSQNLQEPRDVLDSVNRILCDRPRRQGMFTTVVFAVLNTKTRRLRAANAGHHPVLLKTAKGPVSARCPASGPPLGVTRDVHYQQLDWVLNKNDRVLMFSDGVTDARNRKGRSFGLRSLRQVLRGHEGSSRSLIRALQAAVREFTRGAPPFDDLTLLTLYAK